ncbi:hypothetical protein EDB81DRAFT_777268, partial [Dactylonectria macrodidyma]
MLFCTMDTFTGLCLLLYSFNGLCQNSNSSAHHPCIQLPRVIVPQLRAPMRQSQNPHRNATPPPRCTSSQLRPAE